MKCSFPGCESNSVNEGYCIPHGRVYGQQKVKSKNIARYSEKRKKLQLEYLAIVREMLAQNKKCEVKSRVCTGNAQGLHHIEKRSAKNLCDKSILMRSCNACNTYIEQHPAEAKEKGWSISKFMR